MREHIEFFPQSQSNGQNCGINTFQKKNIRFYCESYFVMNPTSQETEISIREIYEKDTKTVNFGNNIFC